ncbi:MAG: arginine repressor [Actinomycetota bacterium]
MASTGAGVKEGRQRRIVRLLRERPVGSQNELAVLLRAAGYRATQATVSRDLEELGVVRVRREGHIVYELPSQEPGLRPADLLGRTLAVSVLSVETTGNLIVVHTPPGHAQMVALAIDQSAQQGIVGTVAGDDTILVVVREGFRPAGVERDLRSLAGLPQAAGTTVPPGSATWNGAEREAEAER